MGYSAGGSICMFDEACVDEECNNMFAVLNMKIHLNNGMYSRHTSIDSSISESLCKGNPGAFRGLCT